MEFREYLDIVRKRWLAITALAVLGALAGLGLSLLSTPMYRATTQIYVSVGSGGTTSDMLQGSSFTRQQIASYTPLVESPLVLGPVIDDLGLDMRADDLAAQMTSDSPLNSSLININVSNESPAIAAAIADAVADEFSEVVADLERPADGGASNVKLTVVREAAVPEGPASPRTKLNVILGFLAGLLAGVGVAVLRDVLDTRIRDESGVKDVTSVSVIGTIAFDDAAASSPLIVQSDPHSPRAESFRRLRTNVQFLDVAGHGSSFVLTSSLPGEGKSSTTINLAIALADAGVRVALVDADLRRPSVARYLGIEGSVGLTTVLIGRAQVDEVMQPWGNGLLHVLPSGQVPPNPSELLGSAAMSALLDKLTSTYDVVLVDTPPLLPVTDAAILAKLTRGALVVVGAGKVHKNQLSQALGALQTVGAPVLGLVVNREPRDARGTYEYYRYETSPSAAPKQRRAKRPTPGTAPTPAAGERSADPDASPSLGTAKAMESEWPAGLSLGGDERQRSSLPPQHQRRSR